MFEESFLINLIIFALGQAAAYGYMRTGRRRRGLALMVGAWTTADIALLESIAFERTGVLFYSSLTAMQVWSLGEFIFYVLGRIRRRLPRVRKRRPELLRRGFLHYLRNELEAADTAYRQVLRNDPWDLEATLALATVMSRMGDKRRAKALFRQARGLDIKGRFRDVISDELQRFGSPRPKPTKRGSGNPQTQTQTQTRLSLRTRVLPEKAKPKPKAKPEPEPRAKTQRK